MHSDVIVVGAGPAGASAAYWLGEAGQQVLVLEKEALPRYKPCGGAVPQAVFGRFPFGFSEVIERWVRHVRFRFRDEREVATDIPERAVATVMRDRFDLHILDHTQAEIRDRTRVIELRQDESEVTVTTAAGEVFRADYLIGADGANSRVAHLVGLRQGKRMGTALEAEAPVGDTLLQEYADTALFIFGTPRKGYLWVFPKADHLSVGIGAFHESVPNMAGTLQREMGRLGIHTADVRQRGHPLPTHVAHQRVRQGRVLLAGDAARLMDPLLGEGIRHAVDSGRLAAESILASDLASYGHRVEKEIGQDLVWGQRWAHLFYSLPKRSFQLGVRNPLFVEEVLGLFTGSSSYRRMIARALPNVLLGLGQRLPEKQRLGEDQ